MKYEVARREAERCFMLRENKIKSEMGGSIPSSKFGTKAQKVLEKTQTQKLILLFDRKETDADSNIPNSFLLRHFLYLYLKPKTNKSK